MDSKPTNGKLFYVLCKSIACVNTSTDTAYTDIHNNNKLWCGAQQTPSPAANDSDLLTVYFYNSMLVNASELWPVITNNLTFDPPTRLLKLTQIESGRPMVTPHLPWKFHANRFSRFLVMLLTKKQRNRSITIPRPPTGGEVITFPHQGCSNTSSTIGTLTATKIVFPLQPMNDFHCSLTDLLLQLFHFWGRPQGNLWTSLQQVFTVQMTFLLANQQCHSTEGIIYLTTDRNTK